MRFAFMAFAILLSGCSRVDCDFFSERVAIYDACVNNPRCVLTPGAVRDYQIARKRIAEIECTDPGQPSGRGGNDHG